MAVTLAVCSLWACGAGRAPERAKSSAPSGSATVLHGSDMTGNLLEGIRGRVPGMLISERSGECPRVLFRGMRSVRAQGSPGIYVDGTRMLDTCILTQISASDIDFVEVYPNGDATRPGIARNPFGLILVFRRQQ
ncbi:MAG: TonB-dependent receptor plug domain-containing protein [Gemmatimonadota bacterium]